MFPISIILGQICKPGSQPIQVLTETVHFICMGSDQEEGALAKTIQVLLKIQQTITQFFCISADNEEGKKKKKFIVVLRFLGRQREISHLPQCHVLRAIIQAQNITILGATHWLTDLSQHHANLKNQLFLCKTRILLLGMHLTSESNCLEPEWNVTVQRETSNKHTVLEIYTLYTVT